MDRRQFLGASVAVTSCLLAGKPASLVRRNLGVGTAGATTAGSSVLPRANAADGRITDVDGTGVALDLRARDSKESVRTLVTRREYPDGEILVTARSNRFRLPTARSSRTVHVDVPAEGSAPGRWFYEAFLERPGGPLHYLSESGPYRWTRNPGLAPERTERNADDLESTSRDGFERVIDGNDYGLRYRWQDSTGRDLHVRYRVRRSVHESAVARDRGYVRTFEESLASPLARDLAAAIADDAVVDSGGSAVDAETGNGDAPSNADAPAAGERFDRLVRFVQDLRYERDAASTGQYDYNRTVEETLVAGVGDCKDKTHLLAGLLGASPLSCETAMLFQPAHVLLGVAAEDVPAGFDDREPLELGGRSFCPVDPSLRFDVGEYPDAPIVAAYGDGRWLHLDLEAAGRGLDGYVRDWLEGNLPGVG